MIFNQPNSFLNVFAGKNSLVLSLVRNCQCLLSKKSKSVLPVFKFFIINSSISIRPGSPVTFNCLYNAVMISRLTICLNCRVDVASVVSGSVDDFSSTLLVSVVLQSS